ncbi:MAG TPA: hypothetical protein VG166_08530 [Caulobacteraceae bacterium]|nr:hypothetical protein [Caulobacteraceae bacterium]
MARRRPADPLTLARRRAAEREAARDPANWGLGRAALDLPRNADVLTRPDPAGRPARAHRQDVFDLLLARGRLGAAAFDAVRRLQDDIALLHRFAGGVASYAPRIDASPAPGGPSEARRRAGRQMESALGLCGPASARLLAALLEPAALGRGPDWRAVVTRECAEPNPEAQGAIVRQACENLAGAYALLDHRPRP